MVVEVSGAVRDTLWSPWQPQQRNTVKTFGIRPSPLLPTANFYVKKCPGLLLDPSKSEWLTIVHQVTM